MVSPSSLESKATTVLAYNKYFPIENDISRRERQHKDKTEELFETSFCNRLDTAGVV